MDLFIDRDAFGRGLSHIQGVVERRSTQPVLSHVLLDAHDQALRMTATDTEVAFIGDIKATVNEPGEIAVDAANLFQVVRTLPEPTVKLSLGPGNRLEIASGRSFFRLPGMSAEDYPTLPAFDACGTASLKVDTLRRLVEQTQFAVATDDARYGLNGAHMEEREAEGNRILRMVSTDGHRLSVSEGLFEGELALSQKALVPRKALAVMKKLLDQDEDAVQVAFGKGDIRLIRNETTFWFRLLEGDFPDYNAVVPQQGKHRAILDRAALHAAVRRVSVLVQDRARPVRFSFHDAELELTVQNVDRGEVRDSIPIELEGPQIVAGFNTRYLDDVLKVLEGDRVTMEMDHPLGPCLIREQGRKDCFFVVMPMRLD